MSRFDLEWMADLMDSQSYDVEAYLDCETGKPYISGGDFGEDVDENAPLDESRYFYLSSIDPSEGYRFMDKFARHAEMPEPIRNKLFRILDGPKPFRKFKDALHSHLDLLNAFEKYKTDKIIDGLAFDLESHGYQLIETPDPPPPAP